VPHLVKHELDYIEVECISGLNKTICGQCPSVLLAYISVAVQYSYSDLRLPSMGSFLICCHGRRFDRGRDFLPGYGAASSRLHGWLMLALSGRTKVP
jgi:hypothetical protein